MGRTNATYRDHLDDYEGRCQSFRRALRREHQPDFDRVFERARNFAHAAGHLNATDPERAALLSMAVAQEAELRALRDELESLRGRVED
ncbi:MAG: hypothetical protein ABEJ88_05620 [Halobacterium sp.]